MAELRLADIVSIIGWLIALAGAGLTVMLTIYFWPQVRLLWQGMTWRLTPALRSWSEANKARAVNRYVYNMSTSEEWDEDENAPFDIPATKQQPSQQRIAAPATDSNAVLFQERTRIAVDLVKSGTCGETKALQIAFQVRPSSSNPRYQEARAALKAGLKPEVETPIAGRATPAVFPSDARRGAS